MNFKPTLVVSLLTFLVTTGAVAQEKSKTAPAAKPAPAAHHQMMTPGELTWADGPPSLPAGAKFVVLEGDPAKEGFVAMRLKLPAGYKVPPHFHPAPERLTVLEGTFMLGSGDKFDEASMKALPLGSYLSMPAQMHHFAMAKTEVVLQLATIGPWGITYLNPTDDPRNKKSK